MGLRRQTTCGNIAAHCATGRGGDIAIHSSATDSERESQAIHQSGSDGQATSPMDRRHHRED